MTTVARFYDHPDAFQSAIQRAKACARREAEALPMELPGFDGFTVWSKPRVRLYKARDGAYVVERKP